MCSAPYTGQKQRLILNELAVRLSGARAPTILDLVEIFGVKSPAVVQYHFKKLEEQRLVTHTPWKSRSQRLTEIGRARVRDRLVPVLGDIAAGVPIAQHGDDGDLVQNIGSRCDFALCVQGTQCRGRGSTTATLPCYDVDAEAALKGYYPERDSVRFVAANDAYEDITIPHGSGRRWDILGKLVGTMRFTDGQMPEAFA